MMGEVNDGAAAWLDEGEVAKRAGAVLAALQGAGCQRGDRAALLAGNGPAFVAARDATTAGGMVLAPVNPALTAPEIAYVLGDSGARVVMAERRLVDVARRGIDSAGRAKIELIEVDALPPTHPLPRPDAIGATLIYTSGTTGRPKGCLRTEAAERARADELIDTYGLSAGDVHLVACRLAHSAPGIFLRACRSVGARTVLMSRFRPQALVDAANRFGATVFFLVPTQYQRLLALADEHAVRAPGSLRAAIVAGAPIAPTTVRRLVEWVGPGRLWQFYGSSETGTVSRLRPDEQLDHPGSVGTPPPGVEVKILAPGDGRALPTGEVGEIFVRSPALMRGYIRPGGNEPVRPNERDGFISVGDLGCVDADGYLYLHGRIDDTILSGGVNVYPAEVERALAEHTEVTGQIVFGLPDADWGQIVCAAIALVPAARAGAAELRAFLRARLAPYKLPKAIAFVPLADLPLGASGKPLRRRAAAIFARSSALVRVDLDR